MSKAILMSIQSGWVCDELNGIKKIEIRTKFPKDYVGWVYIYCTQAKPYCMVGINNNETYCTIGGEYIDEYVLKYNYIGNGKVVARFWCDKVEETFFQQEESFNNEIEKTLKDSCLTYDELWNYVGNKTFYKIHISRLEIFDKPKELKECMSWNSCKDCPLNAPYECHNQRCRQYRSVKRAPQSYMFIGEIENE